jgi:hypothetical protein
MTPELAVAARPRRLGLWILVAMLLAALGLGAAKVGAVWQFELKHPDEHEILIIIPKGTTILQANGKDSLMVPRSLRLTVGDMDTLVIRNEDDFTLAVGPFRLGPNQQYRQRFRAPGVYKLVCSTMYHEDEVVITVLASKDPAGTWLSNWFR